MESNEFQAEPSKMFENIKITINIQLSEPAQG